MGYLSNAGLYIVNTILGIYIFLVLLRFWLHWVQGNFRGPIGELLIIATTPVIKPFKGFAKSPKAWAFICLAVAYLLTVIKNLIVLTLLGLDIAPIGLLVYSLSELIKLSIYLFLACIFISIIASWVAPYSNNPMLYTIRSLSEPILLPARRLIPNFGGIDLSPIAVVIVLNVCLYLIVTPLTDIAYSLGFPKLLY